MAAVLSASDRSASFTELQLNQVQLGLGVGLGLGFWLGSASGCRHMNDVVSMPAACRGYITFVKKTELGSVR